MLVVEFISIVSAVRRVMKKIVYNRAVWRISNNKPAPDSTTQIYLEELFQEFQQRGHILSLEMWTCLFVVFTIFITNSTNLYYGIAPALWCLYLVLDIAYKLITKKSQIPFINSLQIGILLLSCSLFFLGGV